MNAGNVNPGLIVVEGMCKGYRPQSSRQSIKQAVLGPRRRDVARRPVLRDIGFTLTPGSCLGLIGVNGAGKSTLLKCLAGTIVPDAGRIEIHGKVSSLLELGAGFHPDFTGRENIGLNGVILGLSKKRIAELESGIIEFADIGDYIDEPVKTYSSGMYARLAFSVAVNVDPNVLLIDELLAVGDARFSDRSRERMLTLLRNGATVVLATHGLGMVTELCTQALWLHGGRVAAVGPPEVVVSEYDAWSKSNSAT